MCIVCVLCSFGFFILFNAYLCVFLFDELHPDGYKLSVINFFMCMRKMINFSCINRSINQILIKKTRITTLILYISISIRYA